MDNFRTNYDCIFSYITFFFGKLHATYERQNIYFYGITFGDTMIVHFHTYFFLSKKYVLRLKDKLYTSNE